MIQSRPSVVYVFVFSSYFMTQPRKRSVKLNVNRPRSVWCHFDWQFDVLWSAAIHVPRRALVWNTCWYVDMNSLHSRSLYSEMDTHHSDSTHYKICLVNISDYSLKLQTFYWADILHYFVVCGIRVGDSTRYNMNSLHSRSKGCA